MTEQLSQERFNAIGSSMLNQCDEIIPESDSSEDDDSQPSVEVLSNVNEVKISETSCESSSDDDSSSDRIPSSQNNNFAAENQRQRSQSNSSQPEFVAHAEINIPATPSDSDDEQDDENDSNRIVNNTPSQKDTTLSKSPPIYDDIDQTNGSDNIQRSHNQFVIDEEINIPETPLQSESEEDCSQPQSNHSQILNSSQHSKRTIPCINATDSNSRLHAETLSPDMCADSEDVIPNSMDIDGSYIYAPLAMVSSAVMQNNLVDKLHEDPVSQKHFPLIAHSTPLQGSVSFTNLETNLSPIQSIQNSITDTSSTASSRQRSLSPFAIDEEINIPETPSQSESEQDNSQDANNSQMLNNSQHSNRIVSPEIPPTIHPRAIDVPSVFGTNDSQNMFDDSDDVADSHVFVPLSLMSPAVLQENLTDTPNQGLVSFINSHSAVSPIIQPIQNSRTDMDVNRQGSLSPFVIDEEINIPETPSQSESEQDNSQDANNSQIVNNFQHSNRSVSAALPVEMSPHPIAVGNESSDIFSNSLTAAEANNGALPANASSDIIQGEPMDVPHENHNEPNNDQGRDDVDIAFIVLGNVMDILHSQII